MFNNLLIRLFSTSKNFFGAKSIQIKSSTEFDFGEQDKMGGE
jgi:hypothetical protein